MKKKESLRLTWYNALWGRNTNAPVSFQAELFPSGDLVYRYDFSLLPEGFWSNPPPYAIGLQNNGDADHDGLPDGVDEYGGVTFFL